MQLRFTINIIHFKDLKELNFKYYNVFVFEYLENIHIRI